MNDKYHKAMPSLELILDYLDGILDAESCEQFEKAIGKSEELKSIIDGISVYYESEGRNRDKLESYVNDIRMSRQSQTHVPSASESSSNYRFWYKLRIAASIAFLLIVGIFAFYFLRPAADVNGLISGHIQIQYEAPEAFRNIENTSDLLWSEIVDAYQKRNFDAAIDHLDNLPESDDTWMNGQFYMGLCYLYASSSDYRKSIKYLTVVANSDHRMKEQAEWFLALAHYRNQEQRLAVQLFEKIADKNFYKKEEAREILNLISE